MKEISLKDLLEAGCHFGHQTTRWHPKMKPFIFSARDGIHIFDLVKTKKGVEEAAAFAKATVSQGGQIIFIGTKRQAQDIVKAAAQKAGMPYITDRWIGGLITNWEELRKRINRLADLKIKKAEGFFKNRTKKENLLIDREIIKMEKAFGGVSELKDIPAAIFVADGRKDDAALREAKNRSVKTIAIVDTNVNPSDVDFVIPANDDATKSIQLIVDAIAEAVTEGVSARQANEAKAAQKEKKEADKEVKTEKEKKVEGEKEVSIKKKVLRKDGKTKETKNKGEEKVQ